jgi:peptidoglycan hydrolase CwlO-like protein
VKDASLWHQAMNIEDAVDGWEDSEEPPRDLATDIDDLSRDLTEEIEAHRLTRERAEKAEAKLADALGRSLKLIDERDRWKEQAEKAERQLEAEREWYACSQRGLAEANADRKALEKAITELVSEVRECVRACQGNGALFAILDKYDGGEHG